MNTHTTSALRALPRLFTITVLSVLTAGMVGCATSGYEKSEKTSNSLQKAASEIQEGKEQVDAVLVALTDLVQNPAEDLRPQYKTFSKAYAKLVSISDTVDAKAKDMSASGQRYTTQWDTELAEIQNEDIHTRSEARRVAVSASLEKVKRQYQQTKTDFAPFMSDLKDVEKALSLDLTQAGLGTVRKVAKTTNSHGVDLQKSLDTLIWDMRELGVKMSSNPSK